MNISESPCAQEAIISLVLAGTCPDDQEDKLESLEKWAKTSKDKLLIEVEKFLISEAERLIANSEEFDRYYSKVMNQLKAQEFLDKTAP
tara:strand:- start:105 stop:371 length:267 start_codon:yes stop_codon:yes gene_type:complete